MSSAAFLLALLLAVGVNASQLRQPQQLSASGASAGANPEVDAWHDSAKAKLEAECDEMMKKLWAEKRAKLQAIVDALRKQVEDAKAAVAAAEGDVGDEIGHLKKEQGHLKDASKPVDLGPYRKDVADAEGRIRDLEKKIAELEACVDELEAAKADLAEALRRLAEAERKLEASKDSHADQVHEADVEASHVPPAQDDVEAAEDDLARAKARIAAAERALAQAKADLQEHDDGPHPALATDGAAPVQSEPAAPSAPATAHKSDARRAPTVASAIGALMLVAFMY
jgi:exonuclease VII small subunit